MSDHEEKEELEGEEEEDIESEEFQVEKGNVMVDVVAKKDKNDGKVKSRIYEGRSYNDCRILKEHYFYSKNLGLNEKKILSFSDFSLFVSYTKQNRSLVVFKFSKNSKIGEFSELKRIHSGDINDMITWDEKDGIVMTCSSDCSVKTFSIQKRQPKHIKTITVHSIGVEGILNLRKKGMFITVTKNGGVFLVSYTKNQIIRKLFLMGSGNTPIDLMGRGVSTLDLLLSRKHSSCFYLGCQACEDNRNRNNQTVYVSTLINYEENKILADNGLFVSTQEICRADATPYQSTAFSTSLLFLPYRRNQRISSSEKDDEIFLICEHTHGRNRGPRAMKFIDTSRSYKDEQWSTSDDERKHRYVLERASKVNGILHHTFTLNGYNQFILCLASHEKNEISFYLMEITNIRDIVPTLVRNSTTDYHQYLTHMKKLQRNLFSGNHNNTFQYLNTFPLPGKATAIQLLSLYRNRNVFNVLISFEDGNFQVLKVEYFADPFKEEMVRQIKNLRSSQIIPRMDKLVERVRTERVSINEGMSEMDEILGKMNEWVTSDVKGVVSLVDKSVDDGKKDLVAKMSTILCSAYLDTLYEISTDLGTEVSTKHAKGNTEVEKVINDLASKCTMRWNFGISADFSGGSRMNRELCSKYRRFGITEKKLDVIIYFGNKRYMYKGNTSTCVGTCGSGYGIIFLAPKKKKKKDKNKKIENEELPRKAGVSKAFSESVDDTETLVPYYQGFIEDYIPSGKGKLFDKKTFKKRPIRLLYEGEFEHGKYHGYGRLYKPNLHPVKDILIYEGNFLKGQYSGKGIEYHYLSKAGENSVVKYEGGFKEGEYHGNGTKYNFPAGGVVKGKWDEGKLVKESIEAKFHCPLIMYDHIMKHLKATEVVGSGAYGIVYKVKTSVLGSKLEFPNTISNPKFVAVKVMKCQSNLHSNTVFMMTRRGVTLCHEVNSKHVLIINGIIRGRREVGYIMEFCVNSVIDLLSLCSSPRNTEKSSSLDIKEKTRILCETAKGMLALHSKNIMHRDLKWANVMMNSEGVVKITDFDTLKLDESDWMAHSNLDQSSRIGTTGYLAPEVYLGKKYTLSCDVFAFGLMGYSLLFECLNPYTSQFRCSCGVTVQDIIMSNNLDHHVCRHHLRPLVVQGDLYKYPTLVELMMLCWDDDPLKRPSFADIVTILESKMKEEGKKCYTIVELVFENERRGHKMLLLEPRMYKIVEWVEAKFPDFTVHKITDLETKEVLEKDDELENAVERGENLALLVSLERKTEIGYHQVVDVDDEYNNNGEDKGENKDMVIEELKMRVEELEELLKKKELEIKELKSKK